MIGRNPLVLGKKNFETVTKDICSLVESFPSPAYYLGMGGAQFLLALYLFAQGMVVWMGMGPQERYWCKLVPRCRSTRT